MTLHTAESPPLQTATVARRLPLGALLALAATGFLTVLTETVPAGLLPHCDE